MLDNKYLISCIDASIKSEITLGDHSRTKYEGKCIVLTLTKQNQKKNIHNIYYVPHLKNNVNNVGQLKENNCNVIFQWTTCYIYEKPPSRRLIAKVEKKRIKCFP